MADPQQQQMQQQQMQQQQMQPQGGVQQNTTVIIQQPAGGAGAPQNIREWNSGLFGCFEDCMGCIHGYFCMCCLLMSVASRMNESCCVPICLNGGILAMRTKLRTQHGITGSICNDWFATTCCSACAVCQMDRELKSVGLG